MKKEIADKWVEALRSGEYKQAKERLQSEDSLCCLGVLCKIAEKDGVRINTTRDNVLDGISLVSQPEVEKYSGLKTPHGCLPYAYSNEYKSLAMLNDAGESFSKIADIIEKNWEEL